jgi:HTH-type transcriptional regulator/antitoxin MqsA
MKCPVCGAVELIHETRDISYVYKDQQTIIPAVKGEYCSACQEVVLDREQGDRYSELIGLFQRRVNESYIA